MEHLNAYEVGIVGAGPLGLELAVALKRAGISYVQWEAGQIGATMQWWPAGTRWFSSPERIAIAGVPIMSPQQEKSTREEYLAYLRGIVLQFGLSVNTYEKVIAIAKSQDGFQVQTHRRNQKNAYHVRNIVLCTGGTSHPHLLNIPGENLPHVSHFFVDPHTYFQQKVLIVGGRNSAIEAALRCFRVGAHVSLSYRGANLDPKDIKYWLFPEIDSFIKRGKIPAHFHTTPIEITPQTVKLRRSTDQEIFEVPTDFVLLMTGYKADMSLLKQVGVELHSETEAPLFNESTMETNIPNVFVAGTAIAGTQQKYRVFLENCHIHVNRIVAKLTGQPAPQQTVPTYNGRAES